MGSAVHTKGILVVYHRLKKQRLQSFLSVSEATSAVADDSESLDVTGPYYDNPRIMNLSMRMTEPLKGGFKYAYMGQSTLPLDNRPGASGMLFDVCGKKVFRANTDLKLPPIIPRNNTQLKDLAMEGRSTLFGHALLELAYDLVYTILDKRKLTLKEIPVFIPSLRFVEAGIALSTDVSHDTGHVFLLEERIVGKFHKFLGNGTAALPDYFPSQEVRETAKFLAFTQHVQYLKTNGLAFVGDYQGTILYPYVNITYQSNREPQRLDRPPNHHSSVRSFSLDSLITSSPTSSPVT
jgi:hypothetical protein